MNLTPDQKRKIERLAKRERQSPEEVVMRLVDQALGPATPEPLLESFLDGIEHLVGSVEGLEDLSTNPKYMEGFGT